MTIAGRVDRKSEVWSSRFGFIMAAVGSSVGLGNIWRFTYTDRRERRRRVRHRLSRLPRPHRLPAARRRIRHRPPLGSLRRRERSGAGPRLGQSPSCGRRRLARHAVGLLHPHLLLRRLGLVHGLHPLRRCRVSFGRRPRLARTVSRHRFEDVTSQANLPLLLGYLAIFIRPRSAGRRPWREARHRARVHAADADLRPGPADPARLRHRQWRASARRCPSSRG